MRGPAIFLAMALIAQPGIAQPDEDMELQRCIFACLAQSTGNDDPAYHRCVSTVCLGEDRSAAEPAPPPERADAQAVLSVQQSLAALGLDPGPADGIHGPQTGAAIERFRAEHGLAPGGGIDAALLEALQAARAGQ